MINIGSVRFKNLFLTTFFHNFICVKRQTLKSDTAQYVTEIQHSIDDNGVHKALLHSI